MKPVLAAFTLGILITLSFSPDAFAADCGFPPKGEPRVPDGATATSEDIRIAIRDVQDYGTAVQTYLNCMELKKDEFFLNMNTDQRTRWNEDYNALADGLTAIETRLNEEIRIFNRRS